MKVLVLGGSGVLGGVIALHLASLGHAVTVASRHPPAPETPMARLPFLQGDYVAGDFTRERLAGFDWVVMAATHDARHAPPSADLAEHLHAVNEVATPKFFATCREAGVQRALLLGSFYFQAAPHLVERNVYVRSRQITDQRVRAESRPGFDVLSVNPPFLLGTLEGLPNPLFSALVEWATGAVALPPFAPPGGTNFMSFRSLAEAVAGAFERGAAGTAYLVGDENLSYAEFFQLFFDAVGRDVKVAERDIEHPILPDMTMMQGRGNFITYDADAAGATLLAYRRHDVAAAVQELVATYP